APDAATAADAVAKVQALPVADLILLYNAYPKNPTGRETGASLPSRQLVTCGCCRCPARTRPRSREASRLRFCKRRSTKATRRFLRMDAGSRTTRTNRVSHRFTFSLFLPAGP